MKTKTVIAVVLLLMLILSSCLPQSNEPTENEPPSISESTIISESANLESETASEPISEQSHSSIADPSEEVDDGATVIGESEVIHFYELWDLQAGNLAEYPLGSLNQYAMFPVIGDKMHRFRSEGSLLWADIYDMKAYEVLEPREIYNFDQEEIIRFFYADDGLNVYTDTAAYLFDKSFEISLHREWPAFISKGDIKSVALDADFTNIAFWQQDGLYLSAMSPDAVPVLIQKDLPFAEVQMDAESPFPIQFLPSGDLFIGVSMWERIGAFRVINQDGEVLRELPFAASGPHSGGNCIVNKTGALFQPMLEEQEDCYYDFSTGALTSTIWREEDANQYWNQYISDPNNPYIWYASCVYYPPDDYSRVIKTTFVKLDFEHQTATALPLTLNDTKAILLAVGDSGEMVFSYATEDEHGFGVCRIAG